MRLSPSSSMPSRQFTSGAPLAGQPSLITPSRSSSTPPEDGASLHVVSAAAPAAGQPSLILPSAVPPSPATSLSAASLHVVSGTVPASGQPSLTTPSPSSSVAL